MHGLDLYDYGARHYDAALARWITVDPLAEKYSNMSSYNYCANNPIVFVDPNGMFVSPYFDKDGCFLGLDEKGYRGDVYITDSKTFNDNSRGGVAFSKDIKSSEKTKKITG